MKKTANNLQSVTHRTKGDKAPRKPARKLADEPAMKELARMVAAGEVNKTRTLSHLTRGGGTDAVMLTAAGGAVSPPPLPCPRAEAWRGGGGARRERSRIA